MDIRGSCSSLEHMIKIKNNQTKKTLQQVVVIPSLQTQTDPWGSLASQPKKKEASSRPIRYLKRLGRKVLVQWYQTSTHFDLHRCMHTNPHAYTQNTKLLKSIFWSKNKKSNKYYEKCNQDSIAPSAVHFCNCWFIFLKLEARLSQFKQSSCNAWHFFCSLFLYHWFIPFPVS